MITYTSEGLTILLPESTPTVLGKKLVLVNPERIEALFKTLVSFYPVKLEALPVLDNTLKIESEKLPKTCVVCSESDFQTFVDNLKESVDLITYNDFLINHPINTYHFSI